MSKKHFELFAVALATIADDATREEVREVILRVCRESNPRFSTATFDDAVSALRRAERPHRFTLSTFDDFMRSRRRMCEVAA
jgi:phytoene/squalene synthetase